MHSVARRVVMGLLLACHSTRVWPLFIMETSAARNEREGACACLCASVQAA
jgi:hypothetical protein